MADETLLRLVRPLRLVTLLGRLRQGSFNGAIARALPELAPAGVSIAPLGSVGDFPLYDADRQEEGFPEPVRAMPRRSPPPTASSS